MISTASNQFSLIHQYLSKGWSYSKIGPMLYFDNPQGNLTDIYDEKGNLKEVKPKWNQLK